MKHIFIKGTNNVTLLLLHGTGGNEYDLMPIAEMIDPNANILSVRGNVTENGMNRFFKRLSEGVFDEEDLVFRTNELNEFINEASNNYGFGRHIVIAVGYSNGANIASSLLFHIQQSLRGAILFHPMVPRRGITLPCLTDINIFIGAGKNDPLCSVEETRELERILKEQNAKVKLYWGQSGHQLTQQEVNEASIWYKGRIKP